MIYFHCEDINYVFPGKRFTRKWITQIVDSEKYSLGQVNFIFTSDVFLLSINKKYLNHDYFTDVITFDYSTGQEVSGDVYISIDSVKNNAKELNISFIHELLRVMAHGVLHLCGYKDKSKAEFLKMKQKEDYYLSLRTF